MNTLHTIAWRPAACALVAAALGVVAHVADAQTPPGPATMAAPAGAWRFVDDGMVVEFAACADGGGAGKALCARVRSLPPQTDPKDGPPPRCGQELLLDFKPNGRQWTGRAIDPSSGSSYKARLEPGKAAGELALVVSVMGGLFSETFNLQPAPADYVRCT